MTSTFTRVRKLPPQAQQREVVDAVNALIDTTIQKDGPLELGIKTVAAGNYTVGADDQFLRVDCSVSIITILLPAIASFDGRELTVKKIDLSNNTVVLDPNGTETIDGATMRVLHSQYSGLTLRCDAASEWNIKNWI